MSAPVDIASLVVFRVAFGLIMLWEVWRYWVGGRVVRYYVVPDFHFKYFGFEWVTAWPGDGMYVHFAALGVLAAAIAVGAWYRWSAALFCVAFSYVFLLDQAQYLNHFYLICLVSFLLILVPAHRAWSVDAIRGRVTPSNTAPAWALWIVRFQLAVAYVYGGIAKLNGDWLRGEPMRQWLADRGDLPLIGQFFHEWWAAGLFSYGGLAFDLLVVPALLWRPTRAYAFAMAVAFHLTNASLFSIGIFPWFMIVATTMFFEPSWPRALVLRRRAGQAPPTSATQPAPAPVGVALGVLLATFVAVQTLVPFRHLLYSGNVSWTEEGHRFSWRMKLRDKDADVALTAVDPVTGRRWLVDPRNYLTRRQFVTMSGRPDMILQFAHLVADRIEAQGHARPAVYADAQVRLNHRGPQPLIDANVDLAAEPRTLGRARWVLPLDDGPRLPCAASSGPMRSGPSASPAPPPGTGNAASR